MFTPTSFPTAWEWFVDELIPSTVKSQYSPHESWKKKPFSKEDLHFFFKGIEELSLLFTEERPRKMTPYFHHPKYRSSYLLYFLPLQMAKFLTLFQLHFAAIESVLKQGFEKKIIRIADLGAGPGTASLTFLLLLLSLQVDSEGRSAKQWPALEFHWFDTNKNIMLDGKILIETLSSHFPKLRNKVTLHFHVKPWWQASQDLPEAISLICMGHLLNESQLPRAKEAFFWKNLLKKSTGGGILMLEPATRKSAQTLAHTRDLLFLKKEIQSDPSQIWGPCTHAGACPLSQGRDWCHFSYPAEMPGKWFKEFSTLLGSERHWVKFSYLWLASPLNPAIKKDPRLKRVISDSLTQGDQATFLICEPEKAGRIQVSAKKKVHRGQLLNLQGF